MVETNSKGVLERRRCKGERGVDSMAYYRITADQARVNRAADGDVPGKIKARRHRDGGDDALEGDIW